MQFLLLVELTFLKGNAWEPSFDQVLENVSKVYNENREKIINQAIQLEMFSKPYIEKMQL